jgi:hypothetical protein
MRLKSETLWWLFKGWLNAKHYYKFVDIASKVFVFAVNGNCPSVTNL